MLDLTPVMPHSVSLRPARLDDLAELLPLAREAFGEATWSDALFRQLLQNAQPGQPQYIAVAEQPGVGLVGYLVMLGMLDQAEMQALAVRRALRGQGIGSALLREGVRLCQLRGVVRIHLEVRAGNISAQAFYRFHGFQETGRRRQYYQHPVEDAVLMVLDLAPTPH
ncbi:MAG: ribosomal protein S18-alanine N-acetyltransferase [Terriglobales bacterium]